ncbi:SDR family oxidoreductase [Prauserella muralis]|uniref:NAD(P)-dependent oxidoreductase n=1 Tax=Prauserella muralis TaxID=588067 RepID=A0A2V4BJU8_9PSEU|nr:SDR family oxidoreductase [Prauserella muralis]PXY30983.1 NAD(P)-dependent oxidoreductase [Prauserella muralis]TWE14755.1 NAD(P)H dehydrogenase (quinone) [Prauserella muralis]
MIVVTGANGGLGRLVVEGLKSVLPADRIVAAVRTPEKAADLGVPVREADYDRPETLAAAFAGAEKVLLISGSEVGRRVPQHTAAIQAAAQAGARHLVYTSAPKADTTSLVLAPEHKTTEEAIRASGLPFTILRNNWYTENYAQGIAQAAQTGSYVGSAGDGRVASATRADYAAGAVAVLTGEGHEGRTYELSGDVAWSYADLAAEISAATGTEVRYRDVSPEEHKAILDAAGLPEQAVETIVALDRNTAEGTLAGTTGELRDLIGRPTTPLGDTVRTVVKDA